MILLNPFKILISSNKEIKGILDEQPKEITSDEDFVWFVETKDGESHLIAGVDIEKKLKRSIYDTDKTNNR